MGDPRREYNFFFFFLSQPGPVLEIIFRGQNTPLNTDNVSSVSLG